MDLDSRAYSKLINENNTYGGSKEYIKIFDAILLLTKRCDHETSEMWCFHICNLFRKILEENLRILSKNRYIIIYRKLYENDKVHTHQINYIYYNVYDSLVFIPESNYSIYLYYNNHLKKYIIENTILNEYVRRNEIFKSIDIEEFQI